MSSNSTTDALKAVESSFPTEVLIPKKETQQEQFLKKFPEFDGRDIIIAVLDTGVDPSLPGLQTTTTGERKMIDCVDCSGAGDVDTSVVKSAVDGVVEGLTGRKLKIPSTWLNPSGKYHLGLKPIFELYSKSLRKTMKGDRKKEVFAPSHQLASADTLRSMTKHEDALGGTSEKLADKLDREDLASKIDFLKAMEKMDDKGPVADCLVWHDGKQWLACVDTSFRGRLGLCQPMGEFKTTGQYGKLTDKDEATYSFRIDPKGNWLEICVANGAHGSHVANIAAAHFPDEPKKNGLAPGAKVVSFCIGDNRLDSMETGTALTRAFNLCADYGVNVVNMSFGEGVHLPNKGRVIRELRNLVTKHNVVFVTSGGNNGPALTTVGAPGGTTTEVLGIGAYLTPEMADPLYGVFNDVKGNLYPWSSRGPCADGWLGVSLCAPGAALTGVPRYCRQKEQMMNGTSMSSPNAAGTIACLLSALKQSDQSWTPYQIRVALENSAKVVEGLDKFAQGQGIVQLSDAFDYLRAAGNFLPETLSGFAVTVSQGAKSGRGVYLRELAETSQKQEFNVSINASFIEFTDPTAPIDFEKHLLLECPANWVSHPATFASVAQARGFFMVVDPTQIPEGTSAYTEVLAFDPAARHLGPLFRVPVTVVRPITVGRNDDFSHEFNMDAPSGEPVRQFISAPDHATAIEVKVTSLNRIPLDRFILHKVHLEEDTCYRNSEKYKALGPDTFEWTHVFPVTAGRTVELCLARAWSRGTEPAKIRMETRFHGVVRPSHVRLIHGSGATRVHATTAPYRPVEVQPNVSLKTLVLPLKQSSPARIEPLGSQDIFQPGVQVHRMLLSYKLTLLKAAEIRVDLPGQTQFLYESPLDCVRFHIYSSTKELLGAASSFPDRYSHKLEKGEYTIQAQLRHPHESVLEGLRDTPLHVHIRLASPISMDVFCTPHGAMADSSAKKWTKKTLDASQQIAMYLGSVPDEKLPKCVSLTGGAYMAGELTMFSGVDLPMADKSVVEYHLTEYSTRAAKAPSMIVLKEKEVKKEPKEEMQDAIRDLQISWLDKLKDETQANELYTELLSKYPSHLPLLTNKMKSLLAKQTRSSDESDTLQLIISQILEICQPNDVLQYLGARQDNNDTQLGLKKSMDEKKAAIIDALVARASVLVDDHLKGSTLDIPAIFKKDLCGVVNGEKSKSSASLADSIEEVKAEMMEQPASNGQPAKEEEKAKVPRKEVDDAYAEVLKWAAADDEKVLMLSAKHAIAHDHKGRALKYLQKSVNDGRSSGKDVLLAERAVTEICDRLGWVHIANQLKNDIIVRHQDKFSPFQAQW